MEIIQIYLQNMHRYSNDKQTPTRSKQASFLQPQVYSPINNASNQIKNQQNTHVPYHLFSIFSPDARKQQNYLSPQHQTNKKQKSQNKGIVSTKFEPKIQAQYKKNPPINHERLQENDDRNNFSHYHSPQIPYSPKNQESRRYASPENRMIDKNQRPGPNLQQNINNQSPHRRIYSLFNNFDQFVKQTQRSPPKLYNEKPIVRNSPNKNIQTPKKQRQYKPFHSKPSNFHNNQIHSPPEKNQLEFLANNPLSLNRQNIKYSSPVYTSKQVSPKSSITNEIQSNTQIHTKFQRIKTSQRQSQIQRSKKIVHTQADHIIQMYKSRLMASKQSLAHNQHIYKNQINHVKSQQNFQVSKIYFGGKPTQTMNIRNMENNQQSRQYVGSPEQKIKLLNEYIQQLRNKLRNFHNNYGQMMRNYSKQKLSKQIQTVQSQMMIRGSFNEQQYSQKIRRMQQQFQNKLLKTIKKLQAQLLQKNTQIQKTQHDLAIKQQYCRQKLAEKQNKITIYLQLNDQLTQSNQQLRKQINYLSQCLTNKQIRLRECQEIFNSLSIQLIQKSATIDQLSRRIKQFQQLNIEHCDYEIQDIKIDDKQLKSTNDSTLKKISEIQKDYVQHYKQFQQQIKHLQNYTTTLQKDINKQINKINQKISQTIYNFTQSQSKLNNNKLDTVKQEQQEIDNQNEQQLSQIRKLTLQKIHTNINIINDHFLNQNKQLSKLNKQLGRYRKLQSLEGYGSQPIHKNIQSKPSSRYTMSSSQIIRQKQSIQKIKYLEHSIETLQEQFSQELASMRTTIEQNEAYKKQNQSLNEKIREYENMLEISDKNNQEYDYGKIVTGNKFNVVGKIQGQQTNKNVMRKDRKMVSWAQGIDNAPQTIQQLQLQQNSQQHSQSKSSEDDTAKINKNIFQTVKTVKSIKQISEIVLSEAVICTSKNIISESINIPKSVIIYICDILQIPTNRKAYLNSLQEITDMNCSTEQIPVQGQTMLQNIVNFLENNCTAFSLQKLYLQILNKLQKQLKQYKEDAKTTLQKGNDDNESLLKKNHRKVMRILDDLKNNKNKQIQIDQELEQVYDELQEYKQNLQNYKEDIKELQDENLKLSAKNDQIQRIISQQNQQIIRYHLQLQNIKLSCNKQQQDTTLQFFQEILQNRF